MALLMPLPLTVSSFSKIQIGFTFLVPAHPSSPGQRAVKRACVCVFVCVCVCVCVCYLLIYLINQCLWYFDTVGWASGRASGLQKLSDEVLVWLSIWSKVRIVCIWSS